MDLQSTTPPPTTVVVGGGMSGIACALRLSECGVPVIIIEPRNRLGGRIVTVEAAGAALDLGASWIHGVDGNPLVDLARECGATLGASLGPEPTQADCAVAFDITGEPIGPALMDAIAARIDEVDPASVPAAGPDVSVADAVSRLFSPEWLDGLRRTFGETVPSVADDEFLQRVLRMRTADFESYDGQVAELLSLRHYGEFETFPGGDRLVVSGYGRIVDHLTEKLRARDNVTVLLGRAVDNITFDVATGKVVISGSTVSNASEPFREVTKLSSCPLELSRPTVPDVPRAVTGRFSIEAGAAVVTLPLGVLQAGRVSFDPPLPEDKVAAIKRMGMGVIEKVALQFSRVFWPELPEWIEYAGPCGATPIYFFQNLSIHAGAPILTAFIG
eukprot:TRINITY_DN9436_c0_g1_i2.p1 TRINITY_DN9436_c0_g1~~TRINITY_DN9436_c0_g1_i2.p1  ORF type:complete len:388 (+),score=82.30 TRINITY_DN9436_c0_g1_i2:864-2027(+)